MPFGPNQRVPLAQSGPSPSANSWYTPSNPNYSGTAGGANAGGTNPGIFGLAHGPGQAPAAPPAQQQPGIGSTTTGITAGALPQSQIDHASQTMLAPPPQNNFSGGLGGQFNDLWRQFGSQGNVDMLRGAAPQQASLALQQQQANANAGLQQGTLLGRLQGDNFQAGQLARQPLQSLLFQLMSGGFQ